MLSAVVFQIRRALVWCAVVGALSGPGANVAAAAPGPAAPAPVRVPTPGAQVADFAEQYVGSRYSWGGASPAGFDCTGFVMWVYGQFGISLPHNEAGQLSSGSRVATEDLQPGDVLVFGNTYRAGLSHVGIYVGDGQFVHAADERHGVLVSSLWDGYWAPRLVGASRQMA